LMFKDGALILVVLASLSATSLPADVTHSAILPAGIRLHDTQALQGYGQRCNKDLGLLSRNALLDVLRARKDSWLEDSICRRVCHACIAHGVREREVRLLVFAFLRTPSTLMANSQPADAVGRRSQQGTASRQTWAICVG
jgi:hypothetical protein